METQDTDASLRCFAILDQITALVARLKGSDDQHATVGDLAVELREAISNAIEAEAEAEALRQTAQIEALAGELYALRRAPSPRPRSGRAKDPAAYERRAHAASLLGRRVRHRVTGRVGNAIRLDTSPSDVQVEWDEALWGVARGEDLEIVGEAK